MKLRFWFNSGALIERPRNALLAEGKTRFAARQCNKHVRAYLPIFIAITVLSITSGCERSSSYRTKLADNERIPEKAPVLLDEIDVGNVKAISVERGDRIAILALTDKETAQKHLRRGTVRLISDDGKIHLRSDGVDAQAPLLTAGETIPVLSKTRYAARQLTTSRMLTGLLMGLAIIAVILLLFRRIARGWLLLLTLVLSAASARMVLPWAADFVSRAYALLPQPPSTLGSTFPSTGIQHGFSRLIENPPHPQIVAYAVVFVLAFIVLSVLLRGALNRLENRG